MTDLKTAIKNSKVQISKEEINKIVKEVDYSGNEKINYTEFITATIDIQKFVKEGRLRAIFSMFDSDDSGQICVDDLHLAFERMG